MEYIETTLALIHPSPTNPRKTFPAEEMAEMTDSVKRHGILQPILVRPWPECYSAGEGQYPAYELVAGERRYRAAKAAELESIPVMVRNLTDHEVLEIQIIENLQRKGLHEIEEAEGYELMIKEHDYTADQLAEKIGKSRAYVYGRMKLNALCTRARLAFRDGKLTASTALLIARIPGEKMQMEAIDKITGTWEGVMSFRRAAEIIQREFCFTLDKAPFPQENPLLLALAGVCSTCPKRSGNSPELCPDTTRTDVCTDPVCYKDKSAAWVSYQAAEAKKEGKKVITGKDADKIDIDYSNDFEKLDSKNYSVVLPGKDEPPTNREILEYLGSKAPDSLFIENQRKGALVEAVSNDQLKKALKEAGLVKSPTADPAQKKREQQAKEETETREALFLAMREGLKRDFEERGPGLETDEMRIITRHYWTALWHESKKGVARIWVPFATNDSDRIDDVTEMIRTTDSTGVLLRLMMDMAIRGQIHVGTYNLEEPCADLNLMATSVGIDIEAFRQSRTAKKSTTKTAKTTSTPKEAPPAEGVDCDKNSTGFVEVFKVGERVQIDPESPLGAAGKLGVFRGYNKAPGAQVWLDGEPATYLCHPDYIIAAPGDEAPSGVIAPPPTQAARAVVMYAHPDNPDLCWSGRGRKPKWVENWLATDNNTLEMLRTDAGKDLSSAPAGANEKTCAADAHVRCTKTLELPLA